MIKNAFPLPRSWDRVSIILSSDASMKRAFKLNKAKITKHLKSWKETAK